MAPRAAIDEMVYRATDRGGRLRACPVHAPTPHPKQTLQIELAGNPTLSASQHISELIHKVDEGSSRSEGRPGRRRFLARPSRGPA